MLHTFRNTRVRAALESSGAALLAVLIGAGTAAGEDLTVQNNSDITVKVIVYDASNELGGNRNGIAKGSKDKVSVSSIAKAEKVSAFPLSGRNPCKGYPKRISELWLSPTDHKQGINIKTCIPEPEDNKPDDKVGKGPTAAAVTSAPKNPFDFDATMKWCDGLAGTCKKTTTSMDVQHGCSDDGICFVCIDRQGKVLCFSATGESKVIRDNKGKGFVVGVNGTEIPDKLKKLERDKKPSNDDYTLFDACGTTLPKCQLKKEKMPVIVVDAGKSGPTFKIECINLNGTKGCHAGEKQ